MSGRTVLSVGITQDYASDKERNLAVDWLKIQAPVSPSAKKALEHIHEIEATVAFEKYATLSRMAETLRENLLMARESQTAEYAVGFQAAINLVMLKMEGIDMETQAATSIAEMQAGALLSIASELRDIGDYQAVVDFAKAISDGCC
jgi:hypothetical protein